MFFSFLLRSKALRRANLVQSTTESTFAVKYKYFRRGSEITLCSTSSEKDRCIVEQVLDSYREHITFRPKDKIYE